MTTRTYLIALFLGIVMGASVIGAVWFDASRGNATMGEDEQVEYIQNLTGGIQQLMQRVDALEHPREVTEDDPSWNCATMGNHICGDPRATAIVACFDNSAYIGATIEDTFHLMRQCINDYTESRNP